MMIYKSVILIPLFTQTISAADGLPPIPVAINAFTTRTFAKLTRQVFSRVTGVYQDFPSNSTSVILTNVVC